MREVLAEEHPDAVVSITSEVLREYREYERAMTTLVDAAVKPRLSAYVANIGARLAGVRRLTPPAVPFYVMKSNGGVLRPTRSCTSRSPPCSAGRRPARSARR